MESTLNLEQKVPIVEGQWGDWTQVCESAKPLDLIEIDRGNYQHWAMYLDSGYIVHVSQVDGRTEGKVAEKRVDTLQRIARSDRCRVNNLEAHAKAKGLKVADDEVICASISDVVGDEDLQNIPEEHCKIVPYNVYTKNCEYYATSWKYGRGFSAQVWYLL
jgi:HRAS-like suppressor 3